MSARKGLDLSTAAPLSVEQALGLCIQTQSLSDFNTVYDRATAVLEAWKKRRDQLPAMIDRMATRDEIWRDRRAKAVALEGIRAGFRYWLRQVYALISGWPVRTVLDLRWWCELVFEVPKVLALTKGATAWGIIEYELDDDDYGPVLKVLSDRDLLSELLMEFPNAPFDNNSQRDRIHSPWPYFEDLSDWPFDPDNPPLHSDLRLTVDRCVAIVSRAWDHLRRINKVINRPYPHEPTDIHEYRQFRSALDQVLDWSLKAQDSRKDALSEQTPAKLNRGQREKLEPYAIALLLEGRLKVSQIARKIGVPRTTLLGWPSFKKFLDTLQTHAHSRRCEIPKGHRKDGRLEAEDPDG